MPELCKDLKIALQFKFAMGNLNAGVEFFNIEGFQYLHCTQHCKSYLCYSSSLADIPVRLYVQLMKLFVL